jgi:asparagine synthase (glutamine-hydrolysing)
MCGLAGYLTNAWNHDQAQKSLMAMTRAIAHRGPDSHGQWLDAQAGIALGHVRLAIVDLSPAGAQPMHSASGRYVLAYNGEIYNHLDLRAELEKQGRAPAWRGHSDTESLLAGMEVWGMEATVKRCVGMFAFAVWDRQQRALTLCRDRVGEKPLYFGWQGNCFLFASELKALKAHPAFQAAIDRNALALMMRHNHVPAPYSIYQGIHKITPGTLLTLSLGNRGAAPESYWDARQMVAHGLSRPFDGSPEAAVDQLDVLLRKAVGRQMMADVPLGAFLSGGVDSSTVVALMQDLSPRPVNTFTIGFHEDVFNEAPHAKAVAAHLGTHHTELYVTARQAMDVIPRLPGMYCEPFADSSQIPTFLVSQLARQQVTVSLSGDAGDELFGGYNRYLLTQQMWHRLARLPVPVRAALARALLALPAKTWDRLLGPLQTLLPTRLAQSHIGEKVHKGAEVFASGTAIELYRRMVSQWDKPQQLVPGSHEPPTVLSDPARQPQTDNLVHHMMAMDLLSYLPDDILVKVDRAAMAVSLETRVPLLDHEVVEFAWRLPLDYKIRQGTGKWPLRQVLRRYVPQELTERPKMGFGVPIDHWLRGPLKDWAHDLLDPVRMRQQGYLNPDLIQQKWAQHLLGKRNWQHDLWNVLMFQSWLAAQ